MMRKVLFVCALVFAMAASASAAYLWNVNSTDSNNMNYGSAVVIGAFTPTQTSAQSWPTSTFAYAGEVIYTGALDTTMVKTNVLKIDRRATDPRRFILIAWCGSDYAGTTFDVRVWASTATATKPANDWRLFKLYDPGTDTWGRTELTTNMIMATSIGTQAAPWFKTSLATAKTSDPLTAKKGYILELSVPEPGSMIAVLSGLVGLVGYGIRRRR